RARPASPPPSRRAAAAPTGAARPASTPRPPPRRPAPSTATGAARIRTPSPPPPGPPVSSQKSSVVPPQGAQHALRHATITSSNHILLSVSIVSGQVGACLPGGVAVGSSAPDSGSRAVRGAAGAHGRAPPGRRAAGRVEPVTSVGGDGE